MIKAKNISSIPERFLTDGEFLFDLPADWELRKTKSVVELDQENKINQEVAYSFSLPRTPKNSYLLDDLEDFLLVWVYENGELMEFDELRIVEKKEQGIEDEDGFEVEIFGSNWAEKLSRVYLRDLDLGVFEYTQTNALNTWSDPTGLYCATLAHYGGWNQEGSVTRKDLRIWFNLTKLLKACLCHIGWEFKSPFWEGLPGEQLFSYLSGYYWYSYRDKKDPLRVRVGNDVDMSFDGFPTELIFPDQYYDPFDLYNRILTPPFFPAAYLYPPAGQADIDLNLRLKMTIVLPETPINLPSPTWSLILLQDSGFNEGNIILLEQYQGIAGNAQEIVIDLDYRLEGVQPGDTFTLNVQYRDSITPGGIEYPFEIKAGGECRFEPDPPRYIEEDTITLADLFDPEITGLDLYKGMAHLIAGYTEPDFARKTVTMHIPYDAIIGSRVLEGFFQKAVLDWTGKVQGGSVKERPIRDEVPKRGVLMFKKSSDSYIESRKFPKEYWSKEFEIGGTKTELLELENPLFEPTIEIATTVEEIGFLPNGTTVDETPSIMALWDNEDGKLSRKIGPRIAYHHGFIKQQKSDGSDYKFVFEGIAIPQFGYLTQWPTRRVTTGYYYRPVYGNSDSDFYTSCWRLKILKDMFKKKEFDFLVEMNEQDYRALKFRRSVLLEYRGIKRMKVIDIKDFRQRLPTPVTCVEEYENKIQ